MVLTKSELIASLQNEVRILLHLAGKIDRATLDYRPTPKQRSTIELLRYLTVMGPALVRAAKSGAFDPAAWPAVYAELLADVSDADFRAEVEIFGGKCSRGAFLVNTVLCGCAAYRTQIFLYLKSCGRQDLNTMNLWAGVDPPRKD